MAKLGHSDPHNYFEQAIGDGTIKPSTPRMSMIPSKKYENPVKNKIFQIDPEYFHIYRNTKLKAREERLSKYYQRTESDNERVIEFIVDKLVEEYPDLFEYWYYEDNVWLPHHLRCHLTGDNLMFDQNWKLTAHKVYIDSFDALAMQVPEDLVIHYSNSDRDYAGYIHLCHANGWNAEWAIDKDFQWVHKEVENIDKMIPRPKALVDGIIKSGRTTERVGAISFRTNTELNRHPDDEPEDANKFNAENPELYMRVERQTINPFPDEGCFLFTIKTYFVNCDHPEADKRDKIIKAFEKDTTKVYSHWFFDKYKDQVLEWLK